MKVVRENESELPMVQRRVTLKDIALSLGVSVNTVSRALAGRSDISTATQQRVREEADRLGYVPNTLARSLVSGSSGSIGFVITNPSNPFYSELIAGAAEVAQDRGKSIILAISAEDPETEKKSIESLMAAAVDAVIAVPATVDPAPWQRLTAHGTPLVLLNRLVPDVAADFVGIDHRESMREMVHHVVAEGAETVWAMEEDLTVPTVESRVSGYLLGADELGLAEHQRKIVRMKTRRIRSQAQPWHAAEAYRMGLKLAKQPLPDAILCGNDVFALGMIRALTESGVRVPEDVMVTGFADHPYAAYTIPSITSVRLPSVELGQQAMRITLDRITDPGQPLLHKTSYTDLMIRESSSRNGKHMNNTC